MLLIFIWTSSIIFMFLNHPLSFGAILLIQTISISLLTGMLSFNYWFSYILFLIMIGGMLILFIYMTSIASNEKFKFSMKMFTFYSMMTMFALLIIMMVDYFYLNFNIFNEEMINQSINLTYKLSMNKYMNFPSLWITLMMIIYLLITLIAIVKITEIQYGPMRQKF
uniref:NADH-ubiquinone oxidoreductase chain 6 n=1 Tax=Lepidapion squamigerum TaxID=280314 RepID=A0A6B9EUQ9_9CUCU|nr:NADH dehydrogenase subunit 6 [Lepidapion squamigerum]